MQSLILRLEPYCQGGTLAHIADHPTTVPDDAPLTLFDFTGLPERLTPAMMLVLVSHIEGRVQHTRRARVARRARRARGRGRGSCSWSSRKAGR